MVRRGWILTTVRNGEWVSGPSRAFEIYFTRWASNWPWSHLESTLHNCDYPACCISGTQSPRPCWSMSDILWTQWQASWACHSIDLDPKLSWDPNTGEFLWATISILMVKKATRALASWLRMHGSGCTHSSGPWRQCTVQPLANLTADQLSRGGPLPGPDRSGG